MSKEPQISVILPVYNAGKFLAEAIRSILEQSFREFELIIINDGSTDGSDAVIASFKDERVVLIRNERNMGLIASLNKGIAAARSNLIARMDADDIALPERLAMQFQAFKKDPELVLCSTDHFSLVNGSEDPVTNFCGSDELKATLLFAPSFAHPTVMMRNIFRNGTPAYDAKYVHVEDLKLWQDLSFKGKFTNISVPLLKYRSHEAQVSVKYASVQKAHCRLLRNDFLQKKGFAFTELELETHHFIGENVFITGIQQLLQIEKWLHSLYVQNRELAAFDDLQFGRVMCKFWYDSCGYTNLGMKAYRIFFSSELAKIEPVSFSKKQRLIAKCLLRKFRAS